MTQDSLNVNGVANVPIRHVAVVALGGNVASQAGAPEKTLQAALSVLAGDSEAAVVASRLFLTPCFPVGAGPDYINAVAILSTVLSPKDFLARLHATEVHFGRERLQRWGNRTLDLDLIAFDDMVYPDRATYKMWVDLQPDVQQIRAPDELILPHPRMHERAFVLVPMQDVLPDWTHPVLGLTVAQMLAALPAADVQAVVPLGAGQNLDLSTRDAALK